MGKGKGPRKPRNPVRSEPANGEEAAQQAGKYCIHPALFDASFIGGPRQGMDLSWSSHARHAVHVDGTLNDARDVDRGWTVELAIPFSSLTGMPKPRPAVGDRWKFNLYRLRQGPGQPNEAQAYSPPMRGDFHALDRFATLRFEN